MTRFMYVADLLHDCSVFSSCWVPPVSHIPAKALGRKMMEASLWGKKSSIALNTWAIDMCKQFYWQRCKELGHVWDLQIICNMNITKPEGSGFLVQATSNWQHENVTYSSALKRWGTQKSGSGEEFMCHLNPEQFCLSVFRHPQELHFKYRGVQR